MMQPMRNPLVVAGFALMCASVSGSAQTAPYRLVPNWGALPDGAQWGEVPGMAIDASGKLFAFHRAEPPIVELDRPLAARATLPSRPTATSSWPTATSMRAS
jgi:hypothetical protein